MNRLSRLGLCLLSAAIITACDGRDTPPTPGAAPKASAESAPVSPPPAAPAVVDGATVVTLGAASGSRVSGELTVTPEGSGVRITGTIDGLEPSTQHGLHIHQIGDCSAPDASSAGDHFNPGDAPHGNPDGEQHHAGDLPNAHADSYGLAMVDVTVDQLQLGGGGEFDILGRAIVVHAQPDDYTSQPSGASGARIACGVIGTAADA